MTTNEETVKFSVIRGRIGSMSTHISDEAIEAAVEAHCEGTMRAAIEAAAPFIRAQALEDAAKAWREYLPAVAGYGKVQPVPVWLERRAEWTSK